jgi:hypothetical protein
MRSGARPRHVLALTHAVFWAEAATDPLASFVRGTLGAKAAPAVPMIMRRHRLVAEAVRLLAQFHESYRGSPLSVEVAPQPPRRPRAGDRMPDLAVTTVEGHRVRLHQLTARPGVHVLLPGTTVARQVLRGPLVHLHRLAATPGSDLFAIRPDGYVGLRGRCADDLDSWLRRVGAARDPDPHAPAEESI